MKKNIELMHELRKKSLLDLKKEIIKLNDNLTLLKVAFSLQKEKNSSAISQTRKNIARTMTVLKEVSQNDQ